MEKVFLNDRVVDADQVSISVADSGFLYGAGIFETMRSRNGRVFRLDDHLDRLAASAGQLSINNTYSKSYLAGAVDQVLEANRLRDARIRLTLTNGPMTQQEEQRRGTLLIAATPWQGYPAEYYRKGVMVVLCPYRQNTTEPICGHKTTSYYPRMLALSWAHQQKAAEALWFTVDNRLAEGCVSNVFLVKDSALQTPSLETPVLPGVARKTVVEITAQQNIPLLEKDLFIADVLDADEVFLTNVIMEVLPVIQVEKHTVREGKVGPMATRLKEAFDECIRQQCGEEP